MKRQTLDEFIQAYGKDPDSPADCARCGTELRFERRRTGERQEWRDRFNGLYCLGKYGKVEHKVTKTCPVIEVEPGHENWPSFIVKAGDKAAVVQFMNVGEDPAQQHLCIDVHPFVGDQLARASAYGMEVGRRLEAFTGEQAEGTSQGLPGAQLVSVLVGKQASKPIEINWKWERTGFYSTVVDGILWDLIWEDGEPGVNQGWWLTTARVARSIDAGRDDQFVCADRADTRAQAAAEKILREAQ